MASPCSQGPDPVPAAAHLGHLWKLPGKEAAGPTPWSNWVIRDSVIAGAYPASMDNAETERLLRKLLELGINTFVCLQAEFNMNVPDSLWQQGHGLRPYIRDAQRILTGALEAGDPVIKQRKIDFLHLPILDGNVTSDAAMNRLADDCCCRVLRGEKLYIHCWGGHGRTGTLVSIMLGRLYNLPYTTAMRYCQAFHDARVYPQGVRSPQTPVQRAQVRRILTAQPVIADAFIPWVQPLIDGSVKPVILPSVASTPYCPTLDSPNSGAFSDNGTSDGGMTMWGSCLESDVSEGSLSDDPSPPTTPMTSHSPSPLASPPLSPPATPPLSSPPPLHFPVPTCSAAAATAAATVNQQQPPALSGGSLHVKTRVDGAERDTVSNMDQQHPSIVAQALLQTAQHAQQTAQHAQHSGPQHPSTRSPSPRAPPLPPSEVLDALFTGGGATATAAAASATGGAEALVDRLVVDMNKMGMLPHAPLVGLAQARG